MDYRQHPDVLAAQDRVRPILDMIDNEAGPELARLKLLIDRAEGETRNEYYDQFRAVADGVRRSKRMVVQPVLDLANLLSPTFVILLTQPAPPQPAYIGSADGVRKVEDGVTTWQCPAPHQPPTA